MGTRSRAPAVCLNAVAETPVGVCLHVVLVCSDAGLGVWPPYQIRSIMTNLLCCKASACPSVLSQRFRTPTDFCAVSKITFTNERGKILNACPHVRFVDACLVDAKTQTLRTAYGQAKLLLRNRHLCEYVVDGSNAAVCVPACAGHAGQRRQYGKPCQTTVHSGANLCALYGTPQSPTVPHLIAQLSPLLMLTLACS